MPKEVLPLTVVLDNIKDSMDIGMLIRSISAVGAQRLIVLKDCVDIWDKSAIRSAWGGHFRVPLYTDVEWHELQNYIQIDGNATFLTSSRSSILKKLQREIDSKTPEQLDELIDSLEIDDNLDEDDKDNDDDDDDDDDDNEKFSVAPIFSKLFYSVDYSQFSHVTLVITGEKYNIGAQCRKFLFRNNGQGVSLPMADNAKGVNSAVGGSVVLYEIQRQFAEKRKTDCE
ncbi:hypothetical protein FSP39_016354 [Pinctada imbricata]|uniref:tRNA/rRNA methyltransferase SpoU type domain-containing protein n=1 Tax=Pinctada imbricata TaxID=66713 RepID=A0AA88XFU8_PINIB|nr:hypothetical protein FSP39_016354 [Pinctada imbricata]